MLMLKASISPVDAKRALQRLGAHRALTHADAERIEAAAAQSRSYRAGTEIIREGESCGMQLLLSGWAAQTRTFSDGRRQVIGFLVPGDQFEYSFDDDHRATATTLTLCNAVVCAAPAAAAGSSLALAYALGEARMLARLIDQVARLGRLTAAERMCDLLLELLERLDRVGLVENDSFEMPVTQEVFSDALGLTPVHTNRTLQLCRQRGDIVWASGRVRFPDASRLARRLGRRFWQSTADRPRDSEPRPSEKDADDSRRGQIRLVRS